MTIKELNEILRACTLLKPSEVIDKTSFRRADFSGLNLHGEDLRGFDFGNAFFDGADLSGANLSGVNLSRARLEGANLSRANLSGADLSGAYLFGANLSQADLSGANLDHATLRMAHLDGANLSEAKGLLSTIDLLDAYFERTKEGYIAYKTFDCEHKAPNTWKIEAGETIKENVCFDRCITCGCGINVAPFNWVRTHCEGDIWKVLIRWEWLCGVCAPYHSDGKIRCERVQLLEVVKE